MRRNGNPGRLDLDADILRLLIEQSPVAMAMFDRRMRYLIASKRWLTDYELEDREVIGRSHYEIFPEMQEYWKEAHTRCLAGATESSAAEAFTRADGSIDWVRWTVKPWHESDGGIGGIIMLTELVTESKNIQDELVQKTIEQRDSLQESEKRFHLAFEQAAVGIAHVSPAGRFLRINKKLCDITGYNRDEMLDRTFQVITHPEDLDADLTYVQRVLAGEIQNYSMEKRYIRKDGGLAWVNLTVSLARGPGGEPDYFISVIEDITARKRMEQHLVESEAQLRALVGAVDDIVFEFNLDGTYKSVWAKDASLLALPAEELIGRKPSELFSGDFPNQFSKVFQQALETRKTTDIEYLLEVQGGPRWFLSHISPVVLPDGECRTIAMVVRDVTDQRQATEELRRHNEMLVALQETTLELLSQLDLDALLENIVRRAGQLTDARSGYLDLVDAETGHLKPRIGLGVLAEALKHSVKPGEGVAGTVWQTGQPLIVNDYDAWTGRLDAFSHGILSAVIGVPLISNDKVLGVLGLGQEHASERQFSERDVEVLTHFARLATIAIENARLYSIVQQELAERKRTEEVLRQSEEKLRHIVEHSTNMFYSHDPGHVLTYVSPHIEQILGYTPEEALVKWTELASDNPVNERGYVLTQKAIDTGSTQAPFELELIHRDGRRVWVEVRESPVVMDGRVVSIVGSLTDITDRKHSEDLIKTRLGLMEFSRSHSLDEVLQETLDRVGELVASPIGFYHFIEADEKTVSLQAWSTRTLKEFCKAEGKGLHYSIDLAGVWADAVRERKPVVHNDYATLENKKGLPEGHAALIRELVVPIMRSGKIVAILGVGNKPEPYTERDTHTVAYLADIAWEIALRKQSEEILARQTEVLQESQALLKKAEEIARMGSWNWDLVTQKLKWSDGMFRLFGVDRENFEGDLASVVSSRIHPDDQPAVNASNERVLIDGKPSPLEYRIVLPAGGTRNVWAEGELVNNESGEVVALAGYVLDITERRMIEQAIEQRTEDLARSNAELEQFAYVASHDLQEPLRMVSNYVQLLERRYKGKLDSDADEFIHYAADGALRMQSLINDLLAFSRVGTRGRELVSVSSEVILRHVLENLQIKINDDQAKIYHNPLPMVMGDKVQLTQLFQNLIENALKFRSGRPPEIEVTAKQIKGPRGEAMWEFSIRDNGIGIDPEFHERIFIVFQRLHNREEYPGTGMGLAICKKIVERHGGRIWLESEVGKGSTFYFNLKSA